MAEKLSRLLAAMAARAADPDVTAVFVTYERLDGKVVAVIHAPSGLRYLADETILLATSAAHEPARGLH